MPCRTHLWIEDLVSGCIAPHQARCLGKFSRCAALLAGALLDAKMVTKWFHSTRLETRTKESNICASSRVAQPAGIMKVTAGIFAPATDQLTLTSQSQLCQSTPLTVELSSVGSRLASPAEQRCSRAVRATGVILDALSSPRRRSSRTPFAGCALTALSAATATW